MTIKITFFLVTLILVTIGIYSNKLINLKRGLILFILAIILPFAVLPIAFIFKMSGLYLDRDSFMIFIHVTVSIWLLLGMRSFPYVAYALFSAQTTFHKKYNTQNKHVSENLEELASKENLKTAHKLIKIFTILVSYLILYGIWFAE